jgi:hypothetical protein
MMSPSELNIAIVAAVCAWGMMMDPGSNSIIVKEEEIA